MWTNILHVGRYINVVRSMQESNYNSTTTLNQNDESYGRVAVHYEMVND